MERIFLYSHGFAMHADDGGIFSDIIALFPNDTHVLFEYDNWNADGTSAIAATFSERAEKLRTKYSDLRKNHPNAEINLICHSQGCNVAALAQLDGITTTILLTPPIVYSDGEQERARILNKPGSRLLEDGSIARQRSAGFETVYPPYYWDDFINMTDQAQKINTLASKTKLVIVDALQDETIVDNKDYSRLASDLRIEHLNTGHNLIDSSGTRTAMQELIKSLF